MFDLSTNTFPEYMSSISNGTEAIPKGEIQKRVKPLNKINEVVNKEFLAEPEIDNKNLIKSEVLSIQERIFELKPTYEILLKYLSGGKTNYPTLYSLAEYDVIGSLLEHNNSYLKQILEDSIHQIKKFLNTIDKKNRIGICLQKDPEDTSFEIYLIVINIKMKDYKEQNEIEDDICNIVESEIQGFINILGGKTGFEKINEAKRKISIIVDEL